jgi:hypothetical protein
MTFWVAGAVVGSSLIGASAAKGAAKTQSAAADRAAELANEQYYQTRADQAPFRAGGLEAQNRLMTLLGLGGKTPATGATGGGGGSVAGMIANAVQDSGAVGAGGLNIDPNSPDYGKYARDFSMADFTADPGYAFRLSEGQKALDRSAAARGGLISGAALKAAGRYGQDMASQEFTNAFNRYQTNRSNQLNPLQSLMGAGQSATNFLNTTGAANAANVGNLITGGAAAQAAGQVGAANAITGGLGTYLNYSQGNALTNALRGGGGNYAAVANPYFTPISGGTP